MGDNKFFGRLGKKFIKRKGVMGKDFNIKLV